MSADPSPPRVPWIEGLPEPPLCDVPWRGRSVVLADGDVHFCCFSGESVGNVREESFESIWRGPKMQAIRRALARQEMPAECRSTSCPIYRGDEQHFILERIKGTGEGGPECASTRRELQGRLRVTSDGTVARVDLRVLDQDAFTADVFLALRAADGELAFAPDLASFPMPLAAGVEFDGVTELHLFELAPDRQAFVAAEVWVALFAPGSNPNLEKNCYWAAVEPLRVDLIAR